MIHPNIPRSPIAKRFARYKMQRAASAAVAAALHRAPPIQSVKNARRLGMLARRITTCAESASLKLLTEPGEPTRIAYRNQRRCRTMLCPPCARERARRTVKRAASVLDAILGEAPQTRFAFLTLTSRNMPMEQIVQMLTLHETALARFLRYARVRQAFQGHLTGIEVAVRKHGGHWQCGVHSHSLVALGEGYFDRARTIYLSQPATVSLWQEALRASYKPVCHIKAIPDGTAARASLTECLKYAIAPHRLFERDDRGFSVDPFVAACLADALYKKRMTRAGGIFAKRQPSIKITGGAA